MGNPHNLVKMKKNNYLIIILIVILILIGVIIFFAIKDKGDKIDNFVVGEKNEEAKSEEEKKIEKEEVNTLKEESGKTGDSELYEIQEGYNNIKIVTIKSSIKYQVAFSGIIKGQKPEMNELDGLVQKNHPQYAGIWIYENDREKMLELLKKVTNSEYKIDENGYLKIVNKNIQNENDKKIEKAINGEKIYILRNSSTCYIVDEVTGEILDYCFEELDRYQTYEYFQDGNKLIIFMTENRENQLEDKEIIQSVIDLISVV